MTTLKAIILKLPRLILCEFMDHHNNKHQEQPKTYFDGASLHARCGRCGREVMQDSQGNWFTWEK